MRIFSDFDEIKSAVGTEIGVSDWIEVTQDRINRFAEATCDEQWIHVDQERAKKELPGGTTIAHGLLSLRAGAAVHSLRDRPEGPAQHPELRRGQDPLFAPVPADSRLRGRITVAEAEDAPPDGLRANYHLVIEIEGGKRPACVAELIALHYR